MKRLLFFPTFLLLILFYGCSKPESNKARRLLPSEAFDSLATYLERSGDYINSSQVPSIISAEELYQQLDSNVLIIDTRDPNDFAQAHIKDAINLPFAQVLNYIEHKIDPNSFRKIVMVCYSGQESSYASGILRLIGYNNVYSLRWGMSSWHKPTAEAFWLHRISSKYSPILESTANSKNPEGDYPGIETDEVFGYSILHERAEKLFAEGFAAARVSADEVFESNHNYYIINYWPEDLYNIGHIPGAIQYQPKKSLGRKAKLNTLPTDRPIVIYCFSGQHSAFIPAYLRILGYDAKGLIYGTNSFMYDVMVKEKIRGAFTEDEVYNFPVFSGGATSSKSTVEQIAVKPRGGC